MAVNLEPTDFILIGEFCEVSGPCSVLMIPSSIPKLTKDKNFNLEELLLYIMTTDYQNFSGEKWEELCDVACIRTNILPNFHAILHYFTLKDPLARGCVRPSCLAYVTQDLNKLDIIKQDTLAVLNMSAQVLKHSNLQWLKQKVQSFNIKENNTINVLLDKWNYLSQPVLETNTNKPTAWASLCSSGIHLIISGLLKLYSITSRSLEDHIIDPKKLTVSYDLFDRIPTYDVEFRQIMKNFEKDN